MLTMIFDFGGGGGMIFMGTATHPAISNLRIQFEIHNNRLAIYSLTKAKVNTRSIKYAIKGVRESCLASFWGSWRPTYHISLQDTAPSETIGRGVINLIFHLII